MWLIANFGELIDIATYVVSAAAAIAALTPTPKDDSAVAKVRKVIDIIGFNFGHSKNK